MRRFISGFFLALAISSANAFVPGISNPTWPEGVTPPAAVVLVGANAVECSTSSTIAWPSGTAANDVAIVIISWNNAGSPTFNFSGYSSSTGNTGSATYNVNVYYKVLTSGDIASPPSYPGCNTGGDQYTVATYRNATGLAFKTFLGSQTGNCATPGFTKAGSSARVVTWVNGYNTGISGFSPAAPSGFTADGQFTMSAQRNSIASIASSSYVNNAAMTWSPVFAFNVTACLSMEITQ